MKIELDTIAKYNRQIGDNALNKLVMNAMGRVELNELAVNRDLIKSMDFSFSDELEVAPEATAQQKVGVCWLFAAMNLLRYFTQKKSMSKALNFPAPI